MIFIFCTTGKLVKAAGIVKRSALASRGITMPYSSEGRKDLANFKNFGAAFLGVQIDAVSPELVIQRVIEQVHPRSIVS